jgi:hypothetical protein
MEEAAATYAAWSPRPPPSWLGAAALAELGAEAPVAAASGGRGGAWATPRPRLSAALVGASLLAVASAALALTVSGSLRQRDAPSGGVRLPDAARSLRVARVPAAPAQRRARAPVRAPRRTRTARREHRVAFVAVRAVHRPPSAPPPSATSGFTGTVPRRPAARPNRRPVSRPPAPAPAPAAPVPAPPAPVAPAPVTADAPADESPVSISGAAAPATTAQVPAPATTTMTPHAPAASVPATSDRDRWSGPDSDQDDGGRPWGEHDRGGGWHQGRRPCPPAPHGPRRASRH